MAAGLVGAPAVLYHLLSRYPMDAWSVASVVLFVPALVLWTAAHLRLGGSFAVRAEAHELVTGGVYKRLRHPIYVSGMLMILSIMICARKLQWLPLWGAFAVLQVARARKEERVLEATFGQSYRDYKSKTWF